ncbi:MAG: response regulator transcription factor [Flammeovirgaceae bacterium]|nr:response regulator transcription factor [Flammeovirgaceae bacterium]
MGRIKYLSYFSDGNPFQDMVPIRIVLVDDHQIVLDGLNSLLDQDPAFEVMASFSDSEKAWSYLSHQAPDILLTDYSMEKLSGIELIRKVKTLHLGVKCVLLSMHDEPTVVKEAMKEGINGFLLKNVRQNELKEALRKIHSGLIYISAEITTQLLHQQFLNEVESDLTDRECEILKLITKEFSNKQIAEQLFISERTVETHRKNIYRKTGTTTLVGLVKFAYSKKLIDPN